MITLAMPRHQNLYDALLDIYRASGNFAGFQTEMVRLGHSRPTAMWLWENVGMDAESCGS